MWTYLEDNGEKLCDVVGTSTEVVMYANGPDEPHYLFLISWNDFLQRCARGKFIIDWFNNTIISTEEARRMDHDDPDDFSNIYSEVEWKWLEVATDE